MREKVEKILTHFSPLYNNPVHSYVLLYFQLLSGELTFTLNFKMRLSRPVRDEMILREGNVRKYQHEKLSKLNLNLLLRVIQSLPSHQHQEIKLSVDIFYVASPSVSTLSILTG